MSPPTTCTGQRRAPVEEEGGHHRPLAQGKEEHLVSKQPPEVPAEPSCCWTLAPPTHSEAGGVCNNNHDKTN